VPRAVREQCWLKNFGRCFQHECAVSWCGNIVTVFDFHVGHNVPTSLGGSNALDNLQPLCSRCNCSMGDRYTIDTWKAGYGNMGSRAALKGQILRGFLRIAGFSSGILDPRKFSFENIPLSASDNRWLWCHHNIAREVFEVNYIAPPEKSSPWPMQTVVRWLKEILEKEQGIEMRLDTVDSTYRLLLETAIQPCTVDVRHAGNRRDFLCERSLQQHGERTNHFVGKGGKIVDEGSVERP